MRNLRRCGNRKCCRKLPLCVTSREKCVMHLGTQVRLKSSGNTCAATASGGAFRVFQMTPSNLAAQGVTPSQYQSMSLQQQTNIWLQGAGPTQQGSSFNYINSNTGQAISGTNLTQGMAAACSQFGSLICKNDLTSIQSGGGCPTNIIKATYGANGTLANRYANADGSGQTICWWHYRRNCRDYL